MPRAPPVNEPPSLTRNRQGRQTLFVPKTCSQQARKSRRKLQNVRKVRTVLLGGFEHQTNEKPQCSRSIRPRKSHYSDWISNTETVLRKALVAGKTALRALFCLALSVLGGLLVTLGLGASRGPKGIVSHPISRPVETWSRTVRRPGGLRCSGAEIVRPPRRPG